MDREEAAERMPGEDAERQGAVVRLDVRDCFLLEEIQEPVRAAARRQFHHRPVGTCHVRPRRRQVSRAIGVRHGDDDHVWHQPVPRQEGDGSPRVHEMRVSIGEIQNRETRVCPGVGLGQGDQERPLLSHHLRRDLDRLADRDGRRRLSDRADREEDESPEQPLRVHVRAPFPLMGSTRDATGLPRCWGATFFSASQAGSA